MTDTGKTKQAILGLNVGEGPEETRERKAARMTDNGATKAAIAEWLQGDLRASNALQVLQAARRHMCGQLEEAAAAVVDERFERAVGAAAWLALEAAEVGALLGRPQLRVASELAVFDALCAWVAHRLEQRRAEVG